MSIKSFFRQLASKDSFKGNIPLDSLENFSFQPYLDKPQETPILYKHCGNLRYKHLSITNMDSTSISKGMIEGRFGLAN